MKRLRGKNRPDVPGMENPATPSQMPSRGFAGLKQAGWKNLTLESAAKKEYVLDMYRMKRVLGVLAIVALITVAFPVFSAYEAWA